MRDRIRLITDPAYTPPDPAKQTVPASKKCAKAFEELAKSLLTNGESVTFVQWELLGKLEEALGIDVLCCATANEKGRLVLPVDKAGS